MKITTDQKTIIETLIVFPTKKRLLIVDSQKRTTLIVNIISFQFFKIYINYNLAIKNLFGGYRKLFKTNIVHVWEHAKTTYF